MAEPSPLAEPPPASAGIPPIRSSLALTPLRLGGLWIATWALLLLPDVLLYWSGYSVEATIKFKPWLVAGIIALLVSTAKSRRVRIAVIAFLVLNQIVWTGYVVYFGQALSPEHLLLVHQEAADTAIGALAEWQSFLPWLIALATIGAALVLMQWREGANARPRWRVSGWALAILLVTITVAWMSHARIDAAFPGKHTGSIYGPYQAAVGAVRIGMTRVAAAGLNVRAQTQGELPSAAEPVTVVVIMGESINASRLSLYGFKADTTPELAKWRMTPPSGFTFLPKIGFSGGLDTYASVPTFLRAAYWPVQAQRFGVNLFQLAHRRGFKSWYFSAQSLNFLEAAGGAPQAERVQTVANGDALANLAAEVPDGGENSFVFLHQRVNHSPYANSCASISKALYIFHGETTDDARRAAYDNGLRCWDRDVAALVAPFLKRKGAVYIFITADHNELMAENGRWGHGFTDLRVAMVPMMLLTNRPGSDVTTSFKSWSPPTTYRMAQTVALAFGVRLETLDVAPNRFFINNTMPFALAGFTEVEQEKPGVYRVKNFARNGQLLSRNITELSEVAAANAAYALGIASSDSQPLLLARPADTAPPLE